MMSHSLEERLSNRHASAFWNKTLADWGREPPLQPDGFGETVRNRKLDFRIPPDVVKRMERYDRQRHDLRMVFCFAAWAAVLAAFSRAEGKVAVTLPSLPGDSGGQALPVFIGKPSEGSSFKEWLGEWLVALRETYKYSEYWHDYPDRSMPQEALECFSFSYEPVHGREFADSFEKSDGRKVLLHIGNGFADDGICCLHYDEGLYSAELMKSAAEGFTTLLERAAIRPEGSMSDWELRTGTEAARQNRWNDTFAPYDRERTIHDGFERVAARHPDRTAVVCGRERWTYRELSERSNALARRLRQAGVARGDRVAVMLDRSAEWAAAFIAVLKVGAVYVPLDPSYPVQRIEYMLSDSRASALIVSGEPETARHFPGTLVNLAHGPSPLPEEGDSAATRAAVSSDDLAYILYTSGSTGEPKGVMIEHRGVGNLQGYFEAELGIGAGDRILQFASASFDASIWELSMALLTGAQLHIAVPDVIGDLRRFESWMEEQGVTVATLPPTYAIHLDPATMPSLRLVVTAGSESNRELLSKWRSRVTYVNAYGPTETTVCATAWNGSAEPLPESALVPIGTPMPNTKVLIVNEFLQPLPACVAGELVVSGDGLARGYWNKPELTDQKFVRLPADGTRVYRTGDLAKWTPDGRIVFLGRLDRQVKIRGYRIETEEVRQALMEQPGVREAVVTVQTDAGGEPALVAFYTARPDNCPHADALTEGLSSRLPPFMIPAYWTELQDIPLTPNGKPDLKALPSVAGLRDVQQTPGEREPSGDTEVRLAAIWASLLGTEGIRKDDDFFKLGGHSLRAAKMASIIYDSFGVNLPLEQMFRHSSLAGMARRIEALRAESAVLAIGPAPVRSGYRLSPAQTRVFTVESSRPGSTLYVLPFAFWMEPAPDFARLEDAFVRLIERHEPLRTSFGWDGREPVQIVHPSVPFRMERIRDIPERLPDLTDRLVEPFELDKPPLLRAALVEYTDGRSLLLIHLHHIIADGISLGILMNDLTAFLSGRELPPLTVQYKDYCEWRHNREPSGDDEHFWLARFEDYASSPDLPTDYPRVPDRRYEGGTLPLQWDGAMAEAVRKLANRCGTTVHVTMLAAYFVLLSKLTGSEDIVVGSLHAGRNHPDAASMVGMFVHTLAHRNTVTGDLTFETFARVVKERVTEEYEHADYPFERLVRKLKLQGGARNPLFDTMFVLQNLDSPEIRYEQAVWTPHVLEEKWSRFDLVFQAWENKDGMLLWVTYSSSLFRRTTVEKLAEDYRTLLARLADQPDVDLGAIYLTTKYQPVSASRHRLDFRF
ncbi:non-ribosomal peptide synthetase [Cohnella sp. CFH 77786]|uniref:non-ribosomal peptide synthetase n=1 Tax=Cohnella sp. CFH 77786 TaxID=2662265 RepID=UPI001C60C9A5|nr:non-ribosomal peptide synthetase [Cohnella sp. CFH 77786]